MKKTIGLVLVFCMSAAALFAQADQAQKGAPYRDGSCTKKYSFCPKSVLYHETHSNFSYLTYNSINWEKTLVCRKQFMLTLRLGGIYYNFVKLRAAGAPVGLNFLFGGGKWLFDAGFGGTYLFVYGNYEDPAGRFSDQVHVAGVNAHIGIRYMIQKSIFFKAVFDPMYVVMGKENLPLMKTAFQPVCGIGIGYTFRY